MKRSNKSIVAGMLAAVGAGYMAAKYRHDHHRSTTHKFFDKLEEYIDKKM